MASSTHRQSTKASIPIPALSSIITKDSTSSKSTTVTHHSRPRTTAVETTTSTVGYKMRTMPPLADGRSISLTECHNCAVYYSQGLETYRVPMTLYEINRSKVVQSMKKLLENNHDSGGKTSKETSSTRGLILLQGGKQTTRYDTDHEPEFRQESYFHYLFGAAQYPDCYGTISVPEGVPSLFVPTWGVDTEMFCGPSPTFENVKEELGITNVYSIHDLDDFVEKELKRMSMMENDNEDDDDNLVPPKLFLLRGLNTDSGNFATPAHFDGIEKYNKNRDEDTLFPCIAECRVTKSPLEIDLLRYTNWVSSMAHVEVMRACRSGMMEYQLESLFQHHTYTHGGCRHMSYTCICACGPNANILHYGHGGRPNNGRLLTSSDIALLDMGAEYHCYASDITCSFPVSGSFTEDQRIIYESVLNAQKSVLRELRPGVSWVDMHRVAEREILRGLLKCGVLRTDEDGDDDTSVIEKMLDNDLGAIFMPHGLGHLIGIDTHDVGGYTKGTPHRSTRPGLRKLRTARIIEEWMVLTVEPGCYFIDPLINMALSDENQRQFINPDRLRDFRRFGGVRLEDDVWITADGCENLTLCPRDVEEVLDVMKGGQWPPIKDVMPQLKRAWSVCRGGKMERVQLM